MKVQEKDIVIAVGEDEKKKYLLQVTSVEPLKAVICDDDKKSKDLAKHVDLDYADIIANLGNKPLYGNCFGVTIEYVKSDLTIPPWERVLLYKSYGEAEKKLILESLKTTAKILDDQRIFPKQRGIVIHVKEPKGNYSGTYAIKKKENPDILTLRIKDFKTLDYVIYHEMGHAVWFQLMDDSLKARWIKLFYKNISFISDLKDKIVNMRKELVLAKSIRSYSSDLEEDDLEIFQAILKHIRKQFQIKPGHVNILLETGDDLTEIWPVKIPAIPHSKVLITDYSTTEVEEFFSEAFAHHFCPGKLLAKSIQKLMDDTISICRYGSNTKGKSNDD